VNRAFIGAALMRLVVVHPRARKAWPFLPCAAPRDSFHVGPLGERVRILADGTAEQIHDCLPHLRGPAADPWATRNTMETT
jgi:hypothetical protein